MSPAFAGLSVLHASVWLAILLYGQRSSLGVGVKSYLLDSSMLGGLVGVARGALRFAGAAIVAGKTANMACLVRVHLSMGELAGSNSMRSVYQNAIVWP